VTNSPQGLQVNASTHYLLLADLIDSEASEESDRAERAREWLDLTISAHPFGGETRVAERQGAPAPSPQTNRRQVNSGNAPAR
jgi:hypothetical protein